MNETDQAALEDQSTLSSCPFCGSDDTSVESYAMRKPRGHRSYLATCNDCHATGGYILDDREKAVALWNGLSKLRIKISFAVRELLCQRCDQEYPVWYAPNELWNKVQRADEHFFCLTCFALLAEQRGIVPTAWFLRPENEADLANAHATSELRVATARIAELEEQIVAAKVMAERYGDKSMWWHEDKYTKGRRRFISVENTEHGWFPAHEYLATYHPPIEGEQTK